MSGNLGNGPGVIATAATAATKNVDENKKGTRHFRQRLSDDRVWPLAAASAVGFTTADLRLQRRSFGGRSYWAFRLCRLPSSVVTLVSVIHLPSCSHSFTSHSQFGRRLVAGSLALSSPNHPKFTMKHGRM